MTSIAEMKEQQTTGTPVLLFDCVFADGSTERWATHRVRAEEHDYDARVLSHSAFELRIPGDETLDTSGRASICVSNVDGRISQLDRSVGFKGSKLLVRFGFFDLESGLAETPLEAIYSGVGQPANEIREDSARLTFTDRFSLTRILQPSLRIQSTCPWHFPRTADERAEASGGGGEGRYSAFWKCGYSPDQTDGCGNSNGAEPYTECARSVSDCKQRGMYSKDSAGRPTARFGGFTFLPASILVRPHGDKSPRWSEAIEGKARANDPIPLLYGTNWIRALINFARSDGNLTHYELVLSTGQVHRVLKVLADGMEIPLGNAGANMTGTGWFNVVSDGNRNGGTNPFFLNSSGEPEGDPHGSMAILAVAIPNKFLSGNGLPRFEVLLEGMPLPQFLEDETELAPAFTSNPAWILLDLMRRSGWRRDEIDLGSFAKAAQHCDEEIEVFDENGQSRMVHRFELNLALTERKSLTEIVRGIRLSTGLTLALTPTGRLSLTIESVLAKQSPIKRATSNATTELYGGWPAYEFGDGTLGRGGILVRGGRSTLRIWRKGGNETPNRLTVELQDSFRAYQQTSVSVIDAEDERLQGHEISSGLPALGLPNTNQALRAIRHQLNKTLHGNRFAEFESGLQGIGVRPGDLITLTVASEGLDRATYRVLGVSIGSNHETVRLVCRQHEEEWYEQFENGASTQSGSGNVEYAGGVPRVLAGRRFTAEGKTELEIAEAASDPEGGLVELVTRFTPPDNRAVSRLAAPLVDITPNVIGEGGSLTGGRSIYYALSSVDETGAESPLSFLVRADLPSGFTQAAVELTGISKPASATGIRVYRGPHPMELYRLAALDAGQERYIDTGSEPEMRVPADPNYDHAELLWRFELLPDTQASHWSDATIGKTGLGLVPDAYQGAIVRISSGRGSGQERKIIAHTAEEILIDGLWTVIPDATSRFCIVEPGWKSAGNSTSDELRFWVPARFGQHLHVIARSVSTLGLTCPMELCSITKHALGGSGGTDTDVPGEPVFSLSTGDQAEVILGGIGFASLDNTFSVTNGTLTLYYWEELLSPSPYSLGAPAQADSTVLTMNSTAGISVDQFLQIGKEILLVAGVRTTELDVVRGQFGTIAEEHTQDSTLWPLSTRVSTLSFPPGFFGSPASGSYTHRVTLRHARIAAAELAVRNRHGNSPAARNEYTSTQAFGLRTAQGTQLTIQLSGVPSVESRIAPPLPIPSATVMYDAYAVMSTGPIGGDVVLRVRANQRTLAQLTIVAGTSWSNVVSGFGLAPIGEGESIEVDVLSVPTGEGSHPGNDLTVAIRI